MRNPRLGKKTCKGAKGKKGTSKKLSLEENPRGPWGKKGKKKEICPDQASSLHEKL